MRKEPVIVEGAPLRLETLRQHIEASLQGMPKTLEKIGRYALDQPQNVALSKIGELATSISVHPSAIVRFCQSMGFRGFTDFQLVFRESLMSGWPDYSSRIDRLLSEGEQPVELLDRFVDASVRSLMQMKETLDRDRLAKSLSVLSGSKKIYIVGQKRSFPIAFYLAYALRKLDIHSALVESNGGLLLERASWCRPEDGLIAISFAPYSPGTLEVATELARRGLSIVSITDSRFSPLVPLSAEWLELSEHDWVGFRSMAATFALAMTLAVGIAELRGFDATRSTAVAGLSDWSSQTEQ